MAVLIKGVEMPETCLQCPCIDDEYWLCKAWPEYDEPTHDTRPSWCPLVEIPERRHADDKMLEDAGLEV